MAASCQWLNNEKNSVVYTFTLLHFSARIATSKIKVLCQTCYSALAYRPCLNSKARFHARKVCSEAILSAVSESCRWRAEAGQGRLLFLSDALTFRTGERCCFKEGNL